SRRPRPAVRRAWYRPAARLLPRPRKPATGRAGRAGCGHRRAPGRSCGGPAAASPVLPGDVSGRQDEPGPGHLVPPHRGERRGVSVDAECRIRRDIADAVQVLPAEGPEAAGLQHAAGDLRPADRGCLLAQLAFGHDDSPVGVAMIMEPGLLSRQPAQQPYLTFRRELEPLIPATGRVVAHQVIPATGGGGRGGDQLAKAGRRERSSGRTRARVDLEHPSNPIALIGKINTAKVARGPGRVALTRKTGSATCALSPNVFRRAVTAAAIGPGSAAARGAR